MIVIIMIGIVVCGLILLHVWGKQHERKHYNDDWPDDNWQDVYYGG